MIDAFPSIHVSVCNIYLFVCFKSNTSVSMVSACNDMHSELINDHKHMTLGQFNALDFSTS